MLQCHDPRVDYTEKVRVLVCFTFSIHRYITPYLLVSVYDTFIFCCGIFAAACDGYTGMLHFSCSSCPQQNPQIPRTGSSDVCSLQRRRNATQQIYLSGMRDGPLFSWIVGGGETTVCLTVTDSTPCMMCDSMRFLAIERFQHPVYIYIMHRCKCKPNLCSYGA